MNNDSTRTSLTSRSFVDREAHLSASTRFRAELDDYCHQRERELEELEHCLDGRPGGSPMEVAEALLRMTQIYRSRKLTQIVYRYSVLVAEGRLEEKERGSEVARLRAGIRGEIDRLRRLLDSVKEGKIAVPRAFPGKNGKALDRTIQKAH